MMLIKSLSIYGLRGFATNQQINFAIPNGNKASGLTILIGPNNGGKSTIIEALRYLADRRPQSFTEGKRNRNTGGRVKLQIITEDDKCHELTTVKAGGSNAEWQFDDRPNRLPITYVLPSRRYFNPYFHKGEQGRSEYILSRGIPPVRGSALNDFTNRLFRALKSRTDFDKTLGRVLSPVPDWTIDQADSGQYYLKFNASGGYHNSDGLGDGLVSLFFIVDALYDSSAGEVIAIDEPELSLHPTLQIKLADLLADYSRDRQIIYATHSPYFVNFETVIAGAEVARVYKKDGGSVVSSLSRTSVEALAGLLSNLNNPHILGLHAREVFFLEDGVILVEGQEDVVFYKKIAQQLGLEIKGDFFGWGVGGADNMRLIAAMLRDLGFSRVVGLLDANRSELLSELSKKFPKYRFFTIPANDVRSKPPLPKKPSVNGLVDHNGVLHDRYRTPITELFSKLNEYLSNREA